MTMGAGGPSFCLSIDEVLGFSPWPQSRKRGVGLPSRSHWPAAKHVSTYGPMNADTGRYRHYACCRLLAFSQRRIKLRSFMEGRHGCALVGREHGKRSRFRDRPRPALDAYSGNRPKT